MFFVTTLLFTQSAFAAGHSGNNKPGWGHGDKNHHHTGPPGHSVSVHPDDEDGHHNQRFHKFLVAWFQYLHNHPWRWHS